jgi:hypothetical protein
LYPKISGRKQAVMAPDLLGDQEPETTIDLERIIRQPGINSWRLTMRRIRHVALSTFVLGSVLASTVFARNDWALLGTRKVSLAKDTDVIDVTRREGRFTALRIDVEDGPLDMFNIRVVFSNGQSYSPTVRINSRGDDLTRVIDLPGEARTIERIIFHYKGPQRLGAATVRVYGREAEPETSGDRPTGVRSLSDDGWTQMGARQVDFRSDHDVIRVDGQRRFNSILIAVEGADVEISNVSVNFANGEHFDPEVRLVFEGNSRSRFIDLPGEARDIRDIEFTYRTLRRGGNDDKAVVHVYGKTRSANSDRSPVSEGWTEMGARQVDFRSDHDVIAVEGTRRFNSILIAVEGADVELSNVSVNFANGEHYNPEVRLVFEGNSRSRFIDLPGEARDIRNIEFTYRTLRRGGNEDKAVVHVYGKTRSGR